MTDENGALAFAYRHDKPVTATIVYVDLFFPAGLDTPVTISAAGEIYGIPVSIDNLIVPAQQNVYQRIWFTPSEYGQSGTDVNVAIQASNYIAVQDIRIEGTGKTPFESNPCDSGVLGTLIALTASPTYTPSPTFTPTNTPEPTETSIFSWTCELDVTTDEYNFFIPDMQSGGTGTWGQWSSGTGYVATDSTLNNTKRRAVEINDTTSVYNNATDIVMQYSLTKGSIFSTEAIVRIIANDGVLGVAALTKDTAVNGDHQTIHLPLTGGGGNLTKMVFQLRSSVAATWSGYAVIENVTIYGTGFSPCGEYDTPTPDGSTATPTSATNTPIFGGTITPTRTPIGYASLTPTITLTPSQTYTPSPTYTNTPEGTPYYGDPALGDNGQGGFDIFGGFFSWLVDAIQRIFQFLAAVVEFILLLVNLLLGLARLLLSWILTAISRLIALLMQLFNAPAIPLDIMPKCITAPLNYDICAFYYILDWTIFEAGTPGAYIIPLLTAIINIVLIFKLVVYVRNLFNLGANIVNS
jgi:hypothetical protein